MVFTPDCQESAIHLRKVMQRSIVGSLLIMATSLTFVACGSKPASETTTTTGTGAAANVADGSVIRRSNGIIFLVDGGQRHYIPEPATLNFLGLTNAVRTLPDAVVDAVPMGKPMPQLPSRVIRGSSGAIFVIEAGRRRHVPDPATFAALGLQKELRDVPDASLNAIPLGSPLPRQAAPVSPARK